MKVTVDPDRCQGHARCWEICPEVFSLDEVGHSVAASGQVPSALEADVEKAAANCPERAITVSLPPPLEHAVRGRNHAPQKCSQFHVAHLPHGHTGTFRTRKWSQSVRRAWRSGPRQPAAMVAGSAGVKL